MFDNRVALVTGGTRGIGKAVVLRLLKEGVKVAVTATREMSEETAAEFKSAGSVFGFYRADVSDFAAVQETVKKIISDFGKIDIVVNNAGITADGLMMSMNENDFDKVISVNLKGAFNVSKAVLRNMIKNRYGRIINMSSVVGITGNAGQANYAASKAGVIGLTKSIAKEYASRGITCNAVAPGFIMTDMTDKMSDAAKQAVLSSIPVGAYGNPNDVANAVLFLADDNSGYITGDTLKVDGGMCI